MLNRTFESHFNSVCKSCLNQLLYTYQQSISFAFTTCTHYTYHTGFQNNCSNLDFFYLWKMLKEKYLTTAVTKLAADREKCLRRIIAWQMVVCRKLLALMGCSCKVYALILNSSVVHSAITKIKATHKKEYIRVVRE